MHELIATEPSDLRAAEAIAAFCYQAETWIGPFDEGPWLISFHFFRILSRSKVFVSQWKDSSHVSWQDDFYVKCKCLRSALAAALFCRRSLVVNHA